MSSFYNGLAGNPNLHASFSIASSTNASPIQIQTTAPHDFSEGDIVVVSDHATNTAANGYWAVHVVDGSNVRLYYAITSGGLGSPSVGNGVGAATGTIRGIGSLPTFQIPSDGDNITASSVNVGFEAMGDGLQFVLQTVGATLYKPVYIAQRAIDNIASGTAAPVTWLTNTAVSSTTWTRLTDTGSHGTSADFFTGAPYPNVLANDVVDVSFQTSIDSVDPVGHASFYIGLGYELFAHGASPTGTPTKIPGSAVLWNNNIYNQFNTRAQFKIGSLPAGLSMAKLQVYTICRLVAGSSAIAIQMTDDALFTTRILRPTGLVA